ncbi:MAG TPA: hypothetical protein VG406_17670 [Isosphaeraceae bacterium]|jgi:hypothetical protein|nr:hypothetical protein [Isosphaeraceae bacterium]
MDIWDRSAFGGGDSGAGAMWQSVLTDLWWGDVARSAFLRELQGAAGAGALSIKFNVDGYNMDPRSPEFTRGRIVGTIGPAAEGEPRHFVRGRQFLTTGLPDGRFFAPAGRINVFAAVLDREAGKVRLDLGNALPTARPGGDPSDVGPLSLVGIIGPTSGTTTVLPLGDIPYSVPGWYEKTAGLVDLPAGRRLSEAEVDALGENPLEVRRPGPDGTPTTVIAESPGGLFVRADQFVFRLDPGETADVELHATRFGLAYEGANVLAFRDPALLRVQASSPLGDAPPVAIPAGAIDFPARVMTDAKGVAILKIKAGKPENPRGYIDGQVYGVRVALEETLAPSLAYPFHRWLFVSLLVFDAFKPDRPTTWHGSMRAIFQQYANLYPVMKQFLDLGSYEDVREHRDLLAMVFGLDPTDPNAMPVTRDLSKAKREAILDWLKGEPPLEGRPPRRRKGVPEPVAPSAAPPAAPVEGRLSPGGKSVAADDQTVGVLALGGGDWWDEPTSKWRGYTT